MMEAALTSETSVDNYFTRQYNPEDKSELHTRCRENLKYHLILKRNNSSYNDKQAPEYEDLEHTPETSRISSTPEMDSVEFDIGKLISNHELSKLHISKAI
jgi:hypothetical protein